jgi:hypothetical protein
MGGRIPESIRRDVIRGWLQGLSRDQIGLDNGIGTGTVSAIIKECNEADPEFALLREVAVLLKKTGLNLSLFGSAIRLRQLLKKLDLNETQIESLIENVDIHCFKQGLPLQEFLNIVDNVSSLSNKIEIPIIKFPEYLVQLQREIKRLREETEEAKMEKIRQMEQYRVTMNLLNDYLRNKPLYERIKALQMEIAKVKKQRDYLKLELNCRNDFLDQYGYNLEWGIPEEELDLANEALSRNLELIDLKNMLMEIYYSPSKYTDILAMILKRFPSLDLKKKTNEITRNFLNSYGN